MMRIRLHDTLNLAAHLGPLRLVNLVKLLLSYRHTVFYGKVWMWGVPYAVTIEPTNRCNLSCPECPSGSGKLSRATGSLSLEDFRLYLSRLPREVLYLQLYFQGEPLLNDDLPAMIRLAKQRRLYVSVATNGHFLTPETTDALVAAGTDRVIISLDGDDQDSYAAYRKRGNFRAVTEGIRMLREARDRAGGRKPYIIVQSLVLRTNESRLQSMAGLGIGLGADEVQFKPAQLYGEHPELLPENPAFRRYRPGPEKGLVINNPLKNKCFRMWSSAVVTWDGKVVPCCYDKDAEHILGDLKKEPLRLSWKGLPYRDFRKRVFTGRQRIGICAGCGEGSGVRRS